MKSHAEEIFNQRNESPSNLETLENLASQLQYCLEAANYTEDEQEIRQTLTSALRQIDISEIPPVATGV